jgi:hypothetical protein
MTKKIGMSTDSALIEKREELKRRLAAGEYKTLVDIFLEGFDRLIRKIIRRTKPLSIWSITSLLCIAVTLFVFGSFYTIGLSTTILKLFKPYGLGGIIGTILSVIAPVTSVVVINQYIGRIFAFWRNDVLDATATVASLEKFEIWLAWACRWQLHLLFTIIGAALFGSSISIALMARLSLSTNYIGIITVIVLNMFNSAFLYLFLVVVFLSAKLRQIDLKLFPADPSSSELLSRLSHELNICIYFVAVYAAVLTLLSAWSGIFGSLGIMLVLFLWLPIIAMFILNQTSLSHIVRRAKWKTLNEIQRRVEKLQASKNFGNQEAMEAINRLMDYHDRVKSTRNSALDLNTTLNFINSLLLPLLAFLLGNLDKVLALFARNP